MGLGPCSLANGSGALYLSGASRTSLATCSVALFWVQAMQLTLLSVRTSPSMMEGMVTDQY